MQKNTISVMVGKGSLKHNSRVFYAENVDPSRSHLNIEYCNENIKDVYHELFDDANSSSRLETEILAPPQLMTGSLLPGY